MKLKTLVLTGTSFLLFATPALAGEGWYLGLAAGFVHPGGQGVKVSNVPDGWKTVSRQRSECGRGIRSAISCQNELQLRTGVRSRRIRDEGLHTEHHKSAPIMPLAGHVADRPAFANIAYDIQFAPRIGRLPSGLGLAEHRVSPEHHSNSTNGHRCLPR